MLLSFNSHIYLGSSMSFSFRLLLNEFLWLCIWFWILSRRCQNICLLGDCCQWGPQLNKKCLMISIYHLRDKYYLPDNYKFICLCRSFSNGYCCTFGLIFPYYPCSCSLLYVIFIKYFVVAIFAAMLFNQF